MRDLIQADDSLFRRIHVVRYEDFCAAPDCELTALVGKTGLGVDAGQLPSLKHISLSDSCVGRRQEEQTAVWDEAHEVAEYFGYEIGIGPEMTRRKS